MLIGGVPLRAVWDGVIVVALLGIAVADVVVSDLSSPVGRCALAVLIVGGLAVRRTRPVVGAAGIAVGMSVQSLVIESPDELGLLLAVLVGSFAVGAYDAGRSRILGVALISVGVGVAIATDPSDSVAALPETLLIFVGVPVVLGYAFRRAHRDIAVLQLESAVLAGEAADAAAAERRRIARELHDVVAHAVTVIAVQAEAGSAVLDSDPEAARRALEAIGSASRDALVELHRMLDLLGEHGETPPEGGLARLPALVAGAGAAGLRVEVSESGVARPLDAPTDHCAYRVLQEALTNALRHASADRVAVSVAYGAEHLALTVDSFGRRGTKTYGGSGRGLAGLRERVAGLGGTWAADPTDGGFRLRATLPLKPVVRTAPEPAREPA